MMPNDAMVEGREREKERLRYTKRGIVYHDREACIEIFCCGYIGSEKREVFGN